MSRYTQKILAEPTLLAYWPMNDLSSPLVDIKRLTTASQMPVTVGGNTINYHASSPLVQGQDAGLQNAANPGASPYLIVQNADAPTTNVNDWALECWVKYSDNSTNRSGVLLYVGNSASGGYGFYHGASGGGTGLLLQGLLGGVVIMTTGFTPVAGTVYYCVLQRVGGTTTLYINNTSYATSASSPLTVTARTSFLNETSTAGPVPLMTMAHAAVYSAALSSPQRAEHYAVGTTVDPQRLFGEGFGS